MPMSLVWNAVRDFMTFFPFVRLCMNFNTVSFSEKKVLYSKESFTFQSKCCILKKVLY